MLVSRFLARAGRIGRIIRRSNVGPTSRASRHDLDEFVVADDAVRIKRRRDVAHARLLTRSLKLLKVADAGVLLRRLAVAYEVRDRNSGQNGDDGDHDHDFYEGKTLQHSFHGCVPFFCLFLFTADTVPTTATI